MSSRMSVADDDDDDDDDEDGNLYLSYSYIDLNANMMMKSHNYDGNDQNMNQRSYQAIELQVLMELDFYVVIEVVFYFKYSCQTQV